MAVLLLAEHDNVHLSPATLSALAAAREFALPVHVLVAGQDCTAVAEAVASIAGVTEVLCAQASYYVQPTAENLAALLVRLAPGYSYIVAAATARGKSVLPRLAALLDVAPVTDVVRIIDANTFERPVHAANLLSTVRCLESVCVLGIRASAFGPNSTAQIPAPLVFIPAAEDTGLSRVERRLYKTKQSNRPELASARAVISGGGGFGSAENFHHLLDPLAEKLGAALGATRVAVEAGVANDCQVGQSGRTVAPELYIAIGLSGAIQHMSGMKNSKCIVAINLDAQAPICQQADYVLIADLNEAVPALTDALNVLDSAQG